MTKDIIETADSILANWSVSPSTHNQNTMQSFQSDWQGILFELHWVKLPIRSFLAPNAVIKQNDMLLLILLILLLVQSNEVLKVCILYYYCTFFSIFHCKTE